MRMHASGEKPLEQWSRNIAKEDVAEAVLDEVLKPTVHKGSVCIGRIASEASIELIGQ
jgi:hypothetical protein